MKKLKMIMVMLTVSWLTSCQKYLSEPGKVQADIKTVDQLLALVDNQTAGPAWAGTSTYDQAANFSTDDSEINLTAYKASTSVFDLSACYHYTYDSNNIVGLTIDYMWPKLYQKIFTANVILSNVDDVSGDDATKKMVKANAYFDRAYAYWELVNHYCQPYSSGTLQTLGLPLKKTTSYVESIKRATLQETYDFILADITQAQALVNYIDVQPTLRWRVSKAGIDAFLSRYYLFTGDNDKCLQYANSALTSTNAQLVDYNTIKPGTTTTYTGGVTVTYSELNTYPNTKYLAWSEFYYTHLTATIANFWPASPAFVALYDQSNDLRYKLFLPPNGGLSKFKQTGIYRYAMFGSFIPTGPTVAEVLLNKAEAAARKGDMNTALAAVNTLRAKRFITGYNATLTATSPADALGKILQERRRELPFIFRWYDIRRFAYNDDPSDDVTVNHTFYAVSTGAVDVTQTKTYTLAVKSLRYAIPINFFDIAASQGQLVQNSY